MNREKVLRLKTYVLLAVMIGCGSFGDFTLSRGMKHLGRTGGKSLGSLKVLFAGAMTSGTIWLGICLLLLFFLSYLLVLSWADLSFVSPASAVGYAVVALLGYLFLGEHVPPSRWLGIFLICVGVGVIGRTSTSTTETS